MRNAGALACSARPGGFVIESGVMTGRYATLITVFHDVGLHEEQRITIEEWTTGAFVRR
jgi:hypothetical protein